MASTTLVTFILNSVHATTAVDVLGSWDNFSKPYPMQKDLQKGNGSWYGCHVFENIICDGDPADCCMPRDGGLVSGGTYWYFYRRNFDKEFHNPEQPSTSNCPLLPGQTVNVLVIPTDDSQQSQDMPKMTMDPKDRLRAPIPTSKKEQQQPHPSSHADKIPERRHNPLYTPTFARLQTGAGDTVISAYMQNRKPEDLISYRHPAATRPLRSASGYSSALEFRKSTALQRRTTRKRKHTTGGTRPVSRLGILYSTDLDMPQPAKAIREYTNPFLLGTIHDDEAEDEFNSRREFFEEHPRLSRPGTSDQPPWPLNSQLVHRRLHSSPAALPSGALRIAKNQPDEMRISGATLIANVEEELPIQVQSEIIEQDNPNMEWLNHPPKDLHQAGPDQAPMSPHSPEMTPGATTPSNARPPTRSKSQKLKRLASLKSRIKLPHVPSMPKLKSRRPSTRHESEEIPDGKRAVFNETSSTWTPAMTSPSDGSPGFLSPEIKPIANQLIAGSPKEQFSMPLLHQSALHRDDKATQLPVEKPRKQTRPMRGDSLPRIVNNFLPGAFSEQPDPPTRSRGHYPARGSSLPHLLSDVRAASSQETIRQTSRHPVSRNNNEAPLAQNSALADFKFGLPKDTGRPPSAYSFDDGDDAPPPSLTLGRLDSRESFDESVHRDQIRHLLSDGTSLSVHESNKLSHKASFVKSQRDIVGAEKVEEGFGAESFEYLAGAIY